MESFNTNCARSLLGKNVNLHMKDGSVIVNVQLGRIQRGEFKKQRFVTFIPFGEGNSFRIPLESIAWAELLNLDLIIGGEASLRDSYWNASREIDESKLAACPVQ